MSKEKILKSLGTEGIVSSHVPDSIVNGFLKVCTKGSLGKMTYVEEAQCVVADAHHKRLPPNAVHSLDAGLYYQPDLGLVSESMQKQINAQAQALANQLQEQMESLTLELLPFEMLDKLANKVNVELWNRGYKIIDSHPLHLEIEAIR